MLARQSQVAPARTDRDRHNLIWRYATKPFQTRVGRSWLAKVPFPVIDRLEMDDLQKERATCDEQISLFDQEITERASRSVPDRVVNPTQILMTTPGVSCYNGLTLGSGVGPIERFPRPRSLANYFGLTPGCRNFSGDQTADHDLLAHAFVLSVVHDRRTAATTT
jgi:transposase